ncbi:DUF1036 domain-containing protein [Lichenibacterium minor]|uniref:DUF1036 domain-containing protein n=1 Tax=Lichenibacterium minor TaxID=2316528 RepID=A0A4Q2UFE7_9HYPH|nr:DUF1036 domain-containing protein [Lichenibacterium minor]RYC33947.1 DUF1036 domain-containing protein [Lichenibacterium minor]
MRLPLLTAAFAAALAASAPAARADFRVCNNTASRASVALATTNGAAWVSEGWWNLKANSCETLIGGALAAQFYYVYGIDESGGEWKGRAFMCTRDREFRIDGRQDCFVRGFDRTGFLEIDTGKDAKDWTVQLTDPAKPGAVTGSAAPAAATPAPPAPAEPTQAKANAAPNPPAPAPAH